MIKKLVGLQTYVLTGLGLIISAIVKYNRISSIVLTVAICGLFIIGIKDHYNELKDN